MFGVPATKAPGDLGPSVRDAAVDAPGELTWLLEDSPREAGGLSHLPPEALGATGNPLAGESALLAHPGPRFSAHSASSATLAVCADGVEDAVWLGAAAMRSA